MGGVSGRVVAGVWQLGCHTCVRGVAQHEETLGCGFLPDRLYLQFVSYSPSTLLPPSFLILYGPPPSTFLILPFLFVAIPSPLRTERKRGGGGTMWLARHGSDGVSALTEAFHHVFVAVCTPALESPHSKRSLGVCIVLYRPLVRRPLSTLTCTLIFCFYGLMCAYSDSCNFFELLQNVVLQFILFAALHEKKATINGTEFECGCTAGTGSRGWS